jgi:hypothetical protein
VAQRAHGDSFPTLESDKMNRFKEPSTWAGFAAFFQVVAGLLPPQYAWVAHVATAAAGAVAVKMPEAGR